MAQTTQITIDNQTFPSFRSKLNESLSALNTLNSGTSRPSSAAAGTIWLDTTNATNPTLKFYDGADDISLATIDYSANTVNWLDSSVNLVSPVTISGNDTSGAEIRLPEDTDNGSNYVGLKAADSIASNVTFTLPSVDGTDGQALKTDGSGNLSFGDAGRTGTVDWDTTAITADPNPAVSGTGYFVNTTSGAITITLPASPSAGDIVAFADYALTWDTNNLVLDPGSNKINGDTANYTVSTEGKSLTLVYTDSTQGWKVVNDGNSTAGSQILYVTATGGTITTCGDYKIHTFTSPGTFCVSCSGTPGGSNTVDYLVVAGGGGGSQGYRGGGAGAGGFRLSNSTCMPAPLTSPLASPTGLPVSVTGYPITVGAGGGPGPSSNGGTGVQGSSSIFSTITSAGGGGGGGSPGTASGPGGGSGGSGGGGTGDDTSITSHGSGNTPPVSPPQGNPGGVTPSPSRSGAGGGGAGAVGITSPSIPTAGAGGIGSYVVSAGFGGCNGTTGPVCGARYFAGGGGGAGCSTGGSGGNGGGGSGSNGSNTGSTNGTANTGGGAGSNRSAPSSGKSGGSGIVIIRYKYQ